MRLNVENLEGRALMSANVVAAAVPSGAVAVVRVADGGTAPQTSSYHQLELENTLISNFMAPIGSNKGSFCGDGFGPVP